MKKGLLLAMSLGTGFGLIAQAPQVSGVQKANLTHSQANKIDAEQSNFFASAMNTQRNGGNNPSPLTVGTKFSSSRNGFTLLVSQSTCVTANQALGVAVMTHRISADNNPPSVNSGFIQETWTTNNGNTWDSMYYDNDGSSLYRYPSGALFNPASNTTLANAYMVSGGPWTDGSAWNGYYLGYQQFNNSNQFDSAFTVGNPGTAAMAFPRIDFQSTDISVWGTGGLYADPNATTALAQGYRGASLVKATPSGNSFTWTFDSIKPNFHQDLSGGNDCFTIAHTAWSKDGMTGYVVFFGVDAAATTSAQRSFLPLVWKSTDGGASWSRMPLEDFSNNATIQNNLIPATDGNTKAWFTQGEGSDAVVDANGNLHIICCVGSGASNDEDSLGYTWTLTGNSGLTARAFIYDVHTTSSGWDALMVDSLMSIATTTLSPFTDGSAAMDIDARLQASIDDSRNIISYVWVDTRDFSLGAGENAFPDLYGKSVNWSTMNATPEIAFTTTQDFYFHYVSNASLAVSGGIQVPVTNSIDANQSHNLSTRCDHYFNGDIIFPTTSYNIPIGITEQVASFGSVNLFPNPANELVNVNVNLVKAENVSMTLFNTVGQAVLVNNQDMSSGNTNVQLNTANLAAGVYFLNVTAGSSTTTTKLVIQ